MAHDTDCIYCGASTRGVRRGEHIVPDAIGGTRTLRCVCKRCNGDFSTLDNELVSKSPLGLVVQQIEGQKGRFTWGYCSESNIALEARILPGFESPPLWPQLIVTPDDWRFHADSDELERMTAELCLRRFWYYLHRAVAAYRAGERNPRFRFERIPLRPNRGLYPPRVFIQRTINELDKTTTFTCRHHDPLDRSGFAKKLYDWEPEWSRLIPHTSMGVLDPEGRSWFDLAIVDRALTKIGLNLLVHLMSSQQVNRHTYPDPVSYVRNGRPSPPSGSFVWAADIKALGCPENSHKCEIGYQPYSRKWLFVMAFYGGTIGALTRFHGPPAKEWVRAEVIIPRNLDTWTIERSKIYLPRTFRRSLHPDKILPSLPMRNAGVRIEPGYLRPNSRN